MPAALGQLSALTHLVLGRNQLESLPPQVPPSPPPFPPFNTPCAGRLVYMPAAISHEHNGDLCFVQFNDEYTAASIPQAVCVKNV